MIFYRYVTRRYGTDDEYLQMGGHWGPLEHAKRYLRKAIQRPGDCRFPGGVFELDTDASKETEWERKGKRP